MDSERVEGVLAAEKKRPAEVSMERTSSGPDHVPPSVQDRLEPRHSRDPAPLNPLEGPTAGLPKRSLVRRGARRRSQPVVDARGAQPDGVEVQGVQSESLRDTQTLKISTCTGKESSRREKRSAPSFGLSRVRFSRSSRLRFELASSKYLIRDRARSSSHQCQLACSRSSNWTWYA